MNDWSDLFSLEPNLLEVENRCRSTSFLPTTLTGGSIDKYDDSRLSAWKLQHSHAVNKSRKLAFSDDSEDPLERLQISSTAALERQVTREACPSCSRPRKYFCYTCLLPLPSLSNCLPTLHNIPIDVHIVKHRQEVDGKSTAVHACILAPERVSMFTFPSLPDYRPEDTLLVFPGEGSSSIQELSHISWKKVLFIDSTWHQCYSICQDPRIKGLQKVQIESRQTMFWRSQKGKPKEYLATIEAIYYFLVDYHKIMLKKEYSGDYDNLLWFFKYMHDKIHQLYKEDP